MDVRMDELIAELESATEGSQELDAKIYGVVHWPRGDWQVVNLIDADRAGTFASSQARTVVLRHTTDLSHLTYTPPHYTTSIDAALTLVPDDCDYLKFVSDPSGSGWEIGDFSQGLEHYTKRGESITDGDFALALCIASLRARASGEQT